MKKYHNKRGNSGVLAYDLGQDYIRIKFIDGSVYRYTETSVGIEHFEKMSFLGQQGEGLSTFISQFVKKHFAEKE